MLANLPPLIRLDDLTLGYDRHPAVHHLSADIPVGAMVAIIGPNGAGKSTLLKGIAGELRPLGGTIELASSARSAMAYMPQRSEVDTSFPLTVFDMVAMGLWRESGAFGRIGSAPRQRVAAAMATVGLAGFERRGIGTLSGGQLQRARFARLILQDAALILLDEPFAAVDGRTVDDLMQLLHAWHREGRTILTVVHDFDQVRRHFPSALLLAREPVAFGPTTRVLTAELLARARSLSEAFDDAASPCHGGGKLHSELAAGTTAHLHGHSRHPH